MRGETEASTSQLPSRSQVASQNKQLSPPGGPAYCTGGNTNQLLLAHAAVAAIYCRAANEQKAPAKEGRLEQEKADGNEGARGPTRATDAMGVM